MSRVPFPRHGGSDLCIGSRERLLKSQRARWTLPICPALTRTTCRRARPTTGLHRVRPTTGIEGVGRDGAAIPCERGPHRYTTAVSTPAVRASRGSCAHRIRKIGRVARAPPRPHFFTRSREPTTSRDPPLNARCGSSPEPMPVVVVRRSQCPSSYFAEANARRRSSPEPMLIVVVPRSQCPSSWFPGANARRRSSPEPMPVVVVPRSQCPSSQLAGANARRRSSPKPMPVVAVRRSRAAGPW